ncbi:MAG: HAMP domain-containing histidine kinase [Oscillospiraceae bacterium]|nr:HAMP domain-containing histidine kinase [Oscillospiraceae bacterium]
MKSYFARTLLLFFVGLLAILASAFFILLIGMEIGVVAPANAGEAEARSEIARQAGFDTFTDDLKPVLYEYIYFDKNGNVKASSLDGNALSQEASRYAADNVSYSTGAYLFYEDGSRCLFTWRYAVSFTNTPLQNILPGAELIMFILAVAAVVLFFLLFVRGMGRKLSAKLTLVETASEQIARQDLDTPIATSAGIKEFNHALQSMDDMRGALKDALIRQWESEQQRKQEIAALAHDIKTPLTIISGNAELLLEDALSKEQAELAGFIHSAGTRAQQYVGALQQVANIDLVSEEMNRVDIGKMLDELNTVLLPLAQEKSIDIEYVCGDRHYIMAGSAILTRALINIGENAIRYTEPGGHITITIIQNKDETSFVVQDEGAGFSKAALQHAKEMFWRQDKSRTDSNNYGIGLSIAEKVARKHSGRLTLENNSKGGCVTLSVCNGEKR